LYIRFVYERQKLSLQFASMHIFGTRDEAMIFCGN
jgi:hypothetical protein